MCARFPQVSRGNPWRAGALLNALAEHGIAYDWITALGGRSRWSALASPTSCGRNASFAAVSDYIAWSWAKGLER